MFKHSTSLERNPDYLLLYKSGLELVVKKKLSSFMT